MANVWTHGVWTAVPGREDEFTVLWDEPAERAIAQLDTVEPPTLLRDRPNEFVSVGPWPSIEEVDRFRSSDVLRDAQERMGSPLDGFVARTLAEVRHD